MKPPVKNLVMLKYPYGDITQWFGENPILYSSLNIGLIAHNGLDCVRPYGEPMYAVEDGTIVDVKDNPNGYGRHIRLMTDPNAEGIGTEWTYGHMATIAVKVGDKVKEGDLVGTMGNSGFVVSGATPYWKYNPFAGTHLHLGKRKYKLSKTGWRYTKDSPRIDIIDYDNGYLGSIDPYEDFVVLSEPDKIVRPLYLTVVSLLNRLLLKIK